MRFVAVKAACVKVWNWVVLLAPLGVFALTADTAGTLPLAATIASDRVFDAFWSDSANHAQIGRAHV